MKLSEAQNPQSNKLKLSQVQGQTRDTNFSKQIPNSENLLKKAIEKSNVKPFISASDIPQIAFQGAQGVIANAPQNIIENPRATMMAGPGAAQFLGGAQATSGLKKMFLGGESVEPETTEFSEKYLEPKTAGGKLLGTAANIAGGFVLPGVAAVKGVKKSFTPFRKAPIKKDIELIGKEADEIAYTGNKAISENLIKQSREAKTNYRNMAQNTHPENVDMDDLVKVLDDTIDAKALRSKQILSTQERRLLELRGKFSQKGSKVTQVESKILGPNGKPITYNNSEDAAKITRVDELKDFKNEIFNSMHGRSDLEAEFMKRYSEMLDSKGINALSEAGRKYSSAYKDLKKSKPLTKQAIKRVATGNSPQSEVDDLSKVARELGSDAVKKASTIGQNLTRKKNLLEKAARNQKRAAFIGSGIGIGATGLEIIRNVRKIGKDT